MLVFKGNKFFKAIVGGLGEPCKPVAGDSVLLIDCDPGMEAELLKKGLRLNGNRIVEKKVFIPAARHENRYRVKHEKTK